MKPLMLMLASGMLSTVCMSANAGFYLGGMLGTSQPDSKLESLSDSKIDSDVAKRLAAGYSFIGIVAVEMAYIDLGGFDVKTPLTQKQDEFNEILNGLNIDTTGENPNIETDSSGLELAAIVKLPLNPIFDFYARLGAYTYNVDLKGSNSIGSGSASSKDLGTVYGIGFAFTRIPKLTLKLEYAAYASKFDSSDLDNPKDLSKYSVDTSFIGVGAQYHF